MSDSPTLPLPPGPADAAALNAFRTEHGDMLNALLACAKQYGDVVHLPWSERGAVLLSDPSDIHEVLHNTERFSKFSNDGPVLHLIGQSLQTLNHGDALKRRHLLSPLFKPREVAKLATPMLASLKEWFGHWQDESSFRLNDEMHALALHVGIGYHFGEVPLGLRDQLAKGFARATDYLMEHTLDRKGGEASEDEERRQAYEQCVIQLREEVIRIVADRRQQTLEGGDLLTRLVALEKPDGGGLTDTEVTDELLAMLLAGHRTVSLALVGMFECLLHHPEIQDRLIQEQRAMSDSEGEVEMGANQHSLAGQVIKESLRLYPPAGMMSRRCLQETSMGGFRIPKDVVTMFSQWGVHRDARLFENPEQFRPERWVPGFETSLPKYAYFPFGGGPRSCIGKGITLMELNLILSYVSRHFRLVFPEDETDRSFKPGTISADCASTFRPQAICA